MRSTLETIDGHFKHAVFTTYAVNLRFFEEWVPPLLRAAEVRNIVVFVDETQLATALDERGLRSLGRSYYVVSTRVRRGGFHPKLLMLAGAEGVRACISSANLTVEGQLRNIESAFVLDSGEDEHLAPLAGARAFLRRISESRRLCRRRPPGGVGHGAGGSRGLACRSGPARARRTDPPRARPRCRDHRKNGQAIVAQMAPHWKHHGLPRR
jgi:hypothetical protein